MKYLFDIPKNSKIYVNDLDGNEIVIIFAHLDGMYSYCCVEGNTTKKVHLFGGTKLTEYKDGYELRG